MPPPNDLLTNDEVVDFKATVENVGYAHAAIGPLDKLDTFSTDSTTWLRSGILDYLAYASDLFTKAEQEITALASRLRR